MVKVKTLVMKYPYISEKNCKNCGGNIIIKRKRDLENDFCGTSCVGKFYKTKEKEITKCLTCKKEFIKTSKSKNIYCSVQCSNESKKVYNKRICEKCGKEFNCNNIAEIKRGNARFCSILCARRIFDFDKNYFKVIDTPNKAYILGFLYADGCVSKKKTEMIIKLHNKDKNLLEKIKIEMNSEHPIKLIKSKKYEDQVRFSISSIELCEQLINHGVVPKKTFIIKFPELHENLIRHFIRGYFDGDGCITKCKNRNSFRIMIFTASKDFMLSLVDILKINNISTLIYERDNGYLIQMNRKQLVKKFYDYIYTDAELYLERKKNIFPINNMGQ